MHASFTFRNYFRSCLYILIYILYITHASEVSSLHKINILCVNVIILFAQFMNLKNPSKLNQQLSQQYVLALDKLTGLCHEQRSIRYLFIKWACILNERLMDSAGSESHCSVSFTVLILTVSHAEFTLDKSVALKM